MTTIDLYHYWRPKNGNFRQLTICSLAKEIKIQQAYRCTQDLTQKGRDALELLFRANRRLYKAYLLKEQFGQLWDIDKPADARRFFFQWKESLLWQRLEPYCDFARMIDRHWDGIVSYCEPGNKIPLGFVERFNNKIRSLQKRAHGLWLPRRGVLPAEDFDLYAPKTVS